MKKNELKVLQILAEIQNPDKRVEDVAFELFKLGEEKAVERADGQAVHGDEVKKHIDNYMKHVHAQIDKLLQKEYG
jgi:hypothetical protein